MKVPEAHRGRTKSGDFGLPDYQQSPLPASPHRHGVFDVDLFAKAAVGSSNFHSRFETNNNSKFLIVVDGNEKRTKWYTMDQENDFFKSLQDILQKRGSNDDVAVWVDVDFSVLSKKRYDDLCFLLEFHEVTKRDCYVEDVSVTDTKISMFPGYSFCIIDTLLRSDHDENEWETKNLNVIVYNNKVTKGKYKGKNCSDLVVSLHRGQMLGTIHEMYVRIVEHHKNHIPSSDWVQWASFDCLTSSLLPKIDKIVNLVNTIEDHSIPTTTSSKSSINHHSAKELNRSEILRDISIARKGLGKLRSSLSSEMENCKSESSK
jgi:Mg2+ and Co2+ transporter CorA